MTADVQIKKVDTRWVAFSDGKRVANSPCRVCVIKLIMKLTRESNRYETISVYREDDSLEAVLRTGAGNARNSQKNSS